MGQNLIPCSMRVNIVMLFAKVAADFHEEFRVQALTIMLRLTSVFPAGR